MTRGLFFLAPRPECEFPSFLPVPQWARPARREHNRGRTQPSSRRSTSDKTGEATRRRLREALVGKWGPVCHICWSAGVTDHRAVIDLELKWPHPQSFTRDHVRPRSLGGRDSLANQRPAHKVCNEKRGNKPLTRSEAA
jgi:5-methylcytosine-specific restriction endonuclease McrA